MNFGLGGLFILASMRLRVGGWFGFVYVLLALMQNGTFGSWDKAFIIGLTCVLINSVREPEAAWSNGGRACGGFDGDG